MNIYLNLSGRTNPSQISLFSKVQDFLRLSGHKIVYDYLSPEHFGDFYKPTSFHVKHIFDQANELINGCDVVILETSTPSITIGYQIFQALKQEKNVVCLYTKGNKQLFIDGIDDERFQMWEYSQQNYKKVLNIALENLFFEKDSRYNILLDKKMVEYLNEISRETKIPKAAYLRGLIKKDMKER